MTLQEIFNTAIESGWYISRSEYKKRRINNRNPGDPEYLSLYLLSWYMCDVLEECSLAGLISSEDLDKVSKSIKNYLGEFEDLETALCNNNLPFEFEDRLEIYKNWAKRPKIKNKLQLS